MCVLQVCGHECYKRALYELRSLDVADGGPSAVELSELTRLSVDPAEVEQEWWNEGAEDSESLMSRLDELFHQVCVVGERTHALGSFLFC